MLENALKKFLEPYKDQKLVLALSGGADSMALFWGCIELKQPFVALHVDHGWREESRKEADELQKMVEKEGITFFLKRCHKDDFKGNLEESARKIRLQFIREIVQQENAAGVLMAHHADDLSENTLKKLLEGSSLYSLASMRPVIEWDGLTILRPFLEMNKQEIVYYLAKRGHFEDATNHTSQFLRGRFRTELFPFLKKIMRKEVTKSLSDLSHEAIELQDYLDEEMGSIESISGPFGECLFLENPPHPFLIKALIRKKSKALRLNISKEDVSALSEAIVTKKGNFQKVYIENRIIVDRGRLFFLNMKKPLLSEWRWEYTEKDRELTNWKSLFQGCAIGWVPDGKWQITYGDTSFDKWWTSNKVPAFLREFSPIIHSEEGPIFEFLTARVKNKQDNGRKVALQYCACKRSLLE